jgi:protein CMS1
LIVNLESCRKLISTVTGALSSSSLKRIVLDASHIDEKKRGVLDMKDTLPPLVRLLTRPEFKQRYGVSKNPLQLVFY